jgi:hypothetical protein
MSIETDLAFNQRACEIADQASAWFAANGSVDAMDNGPEPICGTDCGDRAPDRVWYTQVMNKDGVKFGYVVMKPGFPRLATAAVSDFYPENERIWAVCAVADHPADRHTPLAPHVFKPDLVHEATHWLDFTTYGYKPVAFQIKHMDDLTSHYYNKAHEFNAFYHQGLYQFLADLHLVEPFYRRSLLAGRPTRNQFFSHLIQNDAYWPIHFVHGLRGTYARKFRRRCYRLFDRYLPRQGITRQQDGSVEQAIL